MDQAVQSTAVVTMRREKNEKKISKVVLMQEEEEKEEQEETRSEKEANKNRRNVHVEPLLILTPQNVRHANTRPNG